MMEKAKCIMSICKFLTNRNVVEEQQPVNDQ